MSQSPLRVAIIGTGFGRTAQLPGFRLTPGVEVVALCGSQPERTTALAAESGIPHAYGDYKVMLDELDLDLVSIVTPVYLHHPMTLAALERGCHVLCEKPMALDAGESREMYERAEAAGVVHMIDHELRFNPTRARAAELIAEGFLGRVYHVTIQSVSGIRADPNRGWNWWFQRSKGGGGVGASGSHQVDLLRWWLGEITSVSSRLNTFIPERKDSAGQWQPVDVDDQFHFLAEFASGAQANVFVSYLGRHATGNRIEIHGSDGSLVLDNDDRLWGTRAGEGSPTEYTVPDPIVGAPGVGANVWSQSFVHLARELAGAIQDRRPLERGATFLDGWRCQAVLDAIYRASDERRWIDIDLPAA